MPVRERERERVLSSGEKKKKRAFVYTQSSNSFNIFCINTRTDMNIAKARKVTSANKYKEGKACQGSRPLLRLNNICCYFTILFLCVVKLHD